MAANDEDWWNAKLEAMHEFIDARMAAEDHPDAEDVQDASGDVCEHLSWVTFRPWYDIENRAVAIGLDFELHDSRLDVLLNPLDYSARSIGLAVANRLRELADECERAGLIPSDDDDDDDGADDDDEDDDYYTEGE
jgi:hypothetical protein